MEPVRIAKPKRILRSFRLFDYRVFDEDLVIADDDEPENKKPKKDAKRFVIQMFGINEKGESCCIFVNDFQPYFFVRVSNSFTRGHLNRFIHNIKQALNGGKPMKNGSSYYDESIVDAILIDKKRLYGFTANDTDQFVRITFKNTAICNRVRNLWYTGEGEKRHMDKIGNPVWPNTELYESKISPLLRYFHIQNISPTGWIKLHSSAVESPVKSTSCTFEYILSKSQVIPMPEKEAIVPFKICSFDIEASSSHGDFPLAQKNYKKPAMQIVDSLKKIGIENQDQFAPLFSDMIYRLFSLPNTLNAETCADIDIVYPKKQFAEFCEPAFVKKQIQRCLKYSIQTLKTEENEVQVKYQTIQSFLENATAIHKTDSQEDNGDNNDDDNDEYEADDCEEDDEGDEGNEEDDVEENFVNRFSKPASTKSIRKTTKIADILCADDEEYSRDDKITYLNEVLDVIFPPLEGDIVTMVGSTFMRYGETEPYLNTCIVLNGCDAIPGSQVTTVNNETELLLQWQQLIQRENPDIIIGYNIFGFDYEFLYRRAIENDCLIQFLHLSRLSRQDELDYYMKKTKKGGAAMDIETHKIVLASGEYSLRYIAMTGRIQIDLYAYFRREFNLASYKLDDVAAENISDDVADLIDIEHDFYGQCTELYTKNIIGLHVGDYIRIEETVFTCDYYREGKKFNVVDIYEKEIEEKNKKGEMVKNKKNVVVILGHHAKVIDRAKKIRWGMAKDDIDHHDIFRLSNGSSSDRAIVAKYCIQDCNLVQHLMRKVDVVTGFVEMSNLCSVPINFLVFRGQGVKLQSYVAKKCMEKGYLMPDLDKSGEDGGYEGAIVLPPKTKIYFDEPVACVDYSSLYPSNMISQNYCHSSKVWAKEYRWDPDTDKYTLSKTEGERDAKGVFKYDNLPGYEYVEIEFDTFEWRRNPANPRAKAKKTKVGKRVCRWAQLPNGEKSVLPSILMELLKARKDTKKKSEKEKDPFMANILDKRQLAYKVTANSLYGQCGARTSAFYEKDVAASTTASGRMMIIYARSIIEDVYKSRVCQTKNHGLVMTNAEYVYGDSVAHYTPLYVYVNGVFRITTPEELAELWGNGNWRTCEEPGKQTKQYCELPQGILTWTERGWTRVHRVIRHELAPEKKMVRIYTNQGIVDVTDDHSLLLKTGQEISPKNIGIGAELLHHPLPYSGLEKVKYRENLVIYFKTQIEAAEYYWRVKTAENYIVLDKSDKPEYKYMARIYRNVYDYSKNSVYRDSMFSCGMDNCVKRIEYVPDYNQYVYDLTTENHHFAAGIGSMIVHNTDSVFFIFNLTNTETGEKIVGKDALEITIELAQEAAGYASQFLKPPMNLAYEKTLMPFALISKKRYVGMLYEEDPNKCKLKYMGLSLKRRDSCDYLKDVFGGIIVKLMKGGNLEAGLESLKTALTALTKSQVPMDKLAITKALRGYYKNPKQIAHYVLADRIGKRDPGNKPKPGDRMKFLHVETANKRALQGDKIETPEYIVANRLNIDYTFYITNQLMKPICQFLGLALEDILKIQGKLAVMKSYKKDMEELKREFGADLEVFNKQKEKYCMAKVKTLLFDKYLTEIMNKRNGLQPLTSFFQLKPTK